MTYQFDVREVSTCARGRWGEIFSRLAPQLRQAQERAGKHVPCPVHGGVNGFRLYPDYADNGACVCNTCGEFRDGFATLMWLTGRSFVETLKAVAEVLAMPDADEPVFYNRLMAVMHDVSKKPCRRPVTLQDIETAWESALPLDWEERRQLPLLKYLTHRGLKHLDIGRLPDLRFSPIVSDLNSDKFFPAMTAVVRDPLGQPVNVHRTLISMQGRKADVEIPKRLCPQPEGTTINGGAIRFGNPGRFLAVAEGIETALSVFEATHLPCWSCISAHGLTQVVVPEKVAYVFIFADKDASETGQKAAQKLYHRLLEEGRKVCIATVPYDIPDGSKGVDWNDVLVQYGAKAFPDLGRLIRESGLGRKEVS